MILTVIPARYASTRFPGKPLVEIQGKSMVQRVYEQVQAANITGEIVVATDDHRIANHVETFGGKAMMTSPNHQTGTDRCAEVAAHFPSAKYILNIQGDEPFIKPKQIRQLADTLKKGGRAYPIATLAKRIKDYEEFINPNVVKVVFTEKKAGMYFSRHPIPFIRGKEREQWLKKGIHYKHIGLYAYRRATLLQIAKFEPTALEQAESLEQLRWLGNGLSIRVGETTFDSFGVDTPEDLERIQRFL